MAKFIKTTLTCFLIILAVWIINLFFFYFPKDFDLRFYEHPLKDFISKLHTEHLDPELKQILNQPFYYLDSGTQMVAFESADHQHVLKFFHARCPLKTRWFLRWKYWKKYLSLRWFSHNYTMKERRLKKIYERTHFAFNHLKDETALVFVYLGQPISFDPKVTICDRKQHIHEISLKNAYFIVQKKLEIVQNRLTRLLQNNALTEAHLAVKQVKQLLKERAEKGIIDRIQTMHNNYGFLQDRAFQLDFGRIHFDPEIAKRPEEEKRRVLLQFESWLKDTFPLLTSDSSSQTAP